jgi:hypothetical protein
MIGPSLGAGVIIGTAPKRREQHPDPYLRETYRLAHAAGMRRGAAGVWWY